METTLIIKLGALGDVVRTTPLLRVLKGRVTWVTSSPAVPLLSRNLLLDRLLTLEDSKVLWDEGFDLVLNLEDDPRAAELATRVRKKNFVGAYLDQGRLVYTASARPWFDMGLISRYGKERADELKKLNRKTYQEILFALLGLRFRGEEYVLNVPTKKTPVPGRVCLEPRAGAEWPMKRWNRYDELAVRLRKAGFQTEFLEHRDTLEEYLDDINTCEYLVCGDTLAMHVGLALQKKVVAIFTCTAPQEIYDYGRMVKVVSPLLEKYFYSRAFVPEACDAVSCEEVYRVVRELAASNRVVGVGETLIRPCLEH